MAAFFENTWFLWWTLAVVIVLRWLHVISPQESQDGAIQENDEELLLVSDPFISSFR
ncbi:MAG TPA: hypothetical protein VMD76_14525 [Candidatus Sulfotelmatobacter sp.]|jgi:hypothetical protein|nr:hypothetical protein [Candidatus Sulfotelmatobacter sp.]